ncbi:hypothetical protein MYX64_06365 [Nitrospinae bacterium AH_259_B05_G02_I21]|nr:hypothetical protein [Nitrospinae bacterium AH_259_B05_G02_I21]
MKVWLKPEAPDEVSIRAGEYDKTFLRADEPFEVNEAECRIIEPTGFFTKDKPKAPKRPDKAPVAPPEGPSRAEEGQA